jgi:cell division protease FtsH
MSRIVKESELPSAITPSQAFEIAYSNELSRATEALSRGLPTLIECEKGSAQYCFRVLRDRIKRLEMSSVLIDGRAVPRPGEVPMGLLGTMLGQIRDAVRGGTDDGVGNRKVLVLQHLDLLVTSSGGLTTEAREAIALLYENPNILWLGFRDPSFALPTTISNLFHHKISICGIPRERLASLVTQAESRRLGRRGLDVYRLYKHVSGLNAIRLRSLMGSLQGEDYPEFDEPAWRQIREATVEGGMTIPEVSLTNDIGGYGDVKEKITKEILDTIRHKESLDDPSEIKRVESLIPRGMIFEGPPGTGKTYFAKAIASALGAAIIVVNGPELKSRWVGESEENLRRIFMQARQSAPAVIVFDELDSFAAARGTYTGSGVEHSMVNQLLTEMDGFRENEQVFVIGTTNFVESIDEALRRPGRFEFHLHIPYPNADDRKAILQIYNKQLLLDLEEDALTFAVRQTGQPIEGSDPSGHWSGDHIKALCRSIARQRLRDNRKGPTTVLEVEAVLTSNVDLPTPTPKEELVIATHECGHAIVAMHTEHSPPIDRISIRGDLAGALGFVRFAEPAHKHVVTHNQLLDAIATLFGGREAENVIFGNGNLTIGSSHDLEQATKIARALVFKLGYQTEGEAEFCSRTSVRFHNESEPMSDHARLALETKVQDLLDLERARARRIIIEHRIELEALRAELLEKKVIEVASLRHGNGDE